MAYEWYADIFCLTSLFMDFCAVYTAGIILNRAVSWKRCMIACVFGVGASVSLLSYDSTVCHLQFTGAWYGTSADDLYGIWGPRPGRLSAGTIDRVHCIVCNGRRTELADCFERQKNRTDHSVWFCGSTAFYRISGQTQGDEKCLPGRSVAVRKEQDIVGVL